MNQRTSHFLYLIGAISLALFSIFRFRGALMTFFILDDFWVMRDAHNVRLQSIFDIQQFFWFGHQGFRLYRPFSTTAYSYVLQSLFGFDSSGHHFFQLVVFAVIILLVIGIVHRLTGSAVAALAAGLIYLLAPGQAVNAYWLSAFTVSGTTIWVMLMLWCWLVLSDRARIVVCTFLQICGLLASEHAIAAPVLCVVASLVRREHIRPVATAILPSVLLVSAYSLAKVLYVRAVPAFAGAYSVNFIPTAIVEQLGQYLGACLNVLAVQSIASGTYMTIGLAVIVLLVVALRGAWNGSEGARWVATGCTIFITCLTPVLVLRGHYYDHYICSAALGVALAVVGLCRLVLDRHWQWLALACAVALLIFDVSSGEKAWRENKIFRLVVHGSLSAASWVKEIQRVTAERDAPYQLFVPINASTNSLFASGEVQTFMPGIPPRVIRFNNEKIFTPEPWQFIVRSAPPIYYGQPLPLWEPRWEWLRVLGWWPRPWALPTAPAG